MERQQGKLFGRNSQKTRNEDGSSTQRRWLDEAKSNKISFDVILVSPTEKDLRGTLELDVTQASTSTVAELKAKIQNQFNVPTYDQKVTFGSVTLEDVDTLFSHRLVDGDILTVEYSYAVDTENIHGIIAHLQRAADFLKDVSKEDVRIYPGSEIHRLATQTLNVLNLEQCVASTFVSASPEQCAANTKYFVHNGGMGLLNGIHTMLLKYSWNQIWHFDLLLYEKVIVTIMEYISEHIPQSQLYQTFQNSIENISRSFLRVTMYPGKRIIPPYNTNFTAVNQDTQFHELIGVMTSALTAMARYVHRTQTKSLTSFLLFEVHLC